MNSNFDATDLLAVQTLRMLAVDATFHAKNGHPGMPMGAAPMAYVLFSRHLRFNPKNPDWPGRDRFVLSAGHGSMLLYGLLHLFGYPLTLDDIKNFRRFASKTPGHPEVHRTQGVETTTGPLGQGFATAVGMAMAAQHLAARFHTPDVALFDNRVWVLASDGDLMEGISHEAASLAGHLKLARLKVLYDENHITIDGPTSLSFTEDVLKRMESYGWKTLRVEDGNDLVALHAAMQQAASEKERPVFIAVRTHIGYGSPKQDTAKVHGSPLSAEDIEKTREFFNWPKEDFFIPPAVREIAGVFQKRGEALEADWEKEKAQYEKKYPEKAALLRRFFERFIPRDLNKKLPVFSPSESLATRESSGKVLQVLGEELPFLLSGSADLHASNNTLLNKEKPFQAETPEGRNFYYGIREHAMAAALNGMARFGGVLPYGATFLVFLDYLKPAYRLSHLMKTHVIYVFTHDSIALGADGPTHQPIEHLWSIRAVPGARVIRPCDANETAFAWFFAVKHREGPTTLVLTRQKLPTLDRSRLAPAEELLKGAYILAEAEGEKPAVVLIGTGSEVHLCLKAKEVLEKEGTPTRVVSAPCLELFEEQDADYREKVLPRNLPKVAVEAGSTIGWWKYIGEKGAAVGIDQFGESAPGEELLEKFGFTVVRVVNAAKQAIAASFPS